MKNELYYKKGRRYIKYDTYNNYYTGLPCNGLVYKHKCGMTVFLLKKDFNVDIDIEKLSYLETKKDYLVKELTKEKLGIYNISMYEFTSQVFKKLSTKK